MKGLDMNKQDDGLVTYAPNGEGHEGHVHQEVTQHPRQNDFDLTPTRPTRESLAHIQGWGADLDRKNRPAVPMERTPPRFTTPKDGKPEQQVETVEVLVSNERPGITPVFSNKQPPSGLSGMLRRLAFKLTENDVRHWFLLIAADRVNMVEGIGQDLLSGKVPNVLAEMGIKAEFEHNKAGLAKKALIGTALIGGAWYLMNRRRDR
jgi:hypothetical protein